MIDTVPPTLLDAIQRHLRERSEGTQAGWESASEDEDTLTGDFCGSLRTGWNEVPTSDGSWHWRVSYKKFRGRGGRALEKEIGADGIVLIEVETADGRVVTKGVLFQAKKVRGSSRSDLQEQMRKMEAVAPGGSAVFEFGPDGYRAAPSAVMISEMGQQPGRIPHPREGIGEFLANRFVPCQTGLRGMYYDAVRKKLIVPVAGEIRVVAANLRHRIRIEAVHASQYDLERSREE